jgi:hypothetical protein
MAKKKAPPRTKLKFGQSDVFPWHQADHARQAIRITRAQLVKLRHYGIINRDFHEQTLAILDRGEAALIRLQRGETDPGR